MQQPPIYIIDEVRVRLAKARQRSRDLISDAEVRIYMLRHPEEVQELLERFVPNEILEPKLPGWTGKRVKELLVQAFEMLDQTERTVGPSKLRAAGIETSDSWGYAADFTKTSPFSGAMTVSRMDRILVGQGREPGWLNGSLKEKFPNERAKLLVWVEAQLGGPAVGQVCRKRKWPKWTFYRHVNKAAGEIALRLDRERLELF